MGDATSQDLRSLEAELEPLAAVASVLSSSPLPTVVIDREGLVRLWNAAAERALGWPARDVLGRPHPAIPDDEQEAYQEQTDRALHGETLVGMDGSRRTRDSRTLLVRVAVAPLRDGAGDIVGVVRTFEDVSRERRADESLREQAALIDLSFDAILVRDFSTDAIRLWNRGAEELYGYSSEDVVGRVSHDVLQTTHPVPVEEAKRLLLTAGHWEGELTHRTKDGRTVVVLSRWAVASSGDRPATILETNTDITERKRLEQERAHLVDQHEIFLSAAAHDLKNPLTVLQGQAQLLQRRIRRGLTDPSDLLPGLADIEDRARRMTALIDEVLDATRLHLGHGLQLHPREVDLVELVQECVTDQQNAAPEHRLSVQDSPAHLIGVWDGERLTRVLENLLSNAVKYSPPESEVIVRVFREENVAVLCVQDRGIGIPAEDMPYVFDWLHRAGNVASSASGTGVGLAGARQIVEQHGGTISVESAPGEGSTFTVRLPLTMKDDGE